MTVSENLEIKGDIEFNDLCVVNGTFEGKLITNKVK